MTTLDQHQRILTLTDGRFSYKLSGGNLGWDRIGFTLGLVVADDVLFDEAQIAIQEMGIRVPDQLQIVAYANKGSIKRYPFPVNLAQCDPERFAEVLGGMLLKRMRGEAVIPATELVPVDIVKMVQTNFPVHASGRSAGVMKPRKVEVKH